MRFFAARQRRCSRCVTALPCRCKLVVQLSMPLAVSGGCSWCVDLHGSRTAEFAITINACDPRAMCKPLCTLQSPSPLSMLAPHDQLAARHTRKIKFICGFLASRRRFRPTCARGGTAVIVPPVGAPTKFACCRRGSGGRPLCGLGCPLLPDRRGRTTSLRA